MKLHSIDRSLLSIPLSRQRQEFNPDALVELATSIASNGLIHPLVVRKGESGEFILVAGERRLKALEYLWNFGEQVRCNNTNFNESMVPCTYLGDLSELEAFEVEFEENTQRTDFTWQEKAIATSRLNEFRTRQAQAEGKSPPTVEDLTLELHDQSGGNAFVQTREELIVARHLNDPEVAKAGSTKEAFKILKRKEETKRNQALGDSIGKTYSSSSHSLVNTDCLDWLKLSPPNEFDIILTDPPYGMGAEAFNDSGGKTPGGHTYDDSLNTWVRIMEVFAPESYRVAKENAHLYCFCDIDRFHQLKVMLTIPGWKCFRTPFIWNNPTSMRAPWPEAGPQRKWQMCLYAVKGSKPVTQLYGDVLVYKSDDNLGHHAQKPVDLYKDLLKRSARPGDKVLDPFCGSGTIFPAAHAFKLYATGIELDTGNYGIASQRLKALK